MERVQIVGSHPAQLNCVPKSTLSRLARGKPKTSPRWKYCNISMTQEKTNTAMERVNGETTRKALTRWYRKITTRKSLMKDLINMI